VFSFGKAITLIRNNKNFFFSREGNEMGKTAGKEWLSKNYGLTAQPCAFSYCVTLALPDSAIPDLLHNFEINVPSYMFSLLFHLFNLDGRVALTKQLALVGEKRNNWLIRYMFRNRKNEQMVDEKTLIEKNVAQSTKGRKSSQTSKGRKRRAKQKELEGEKEKEGEEELTRGPNDVLLSQQQQEMEGEGEGEMTRLPNEQQQMELATQILAGNEAVAEQQGKEREETTSSANLNVPNKAGIGALRYTLNLKGGDYQILLEELDEMIEILNKPEYYTDSNMSYYCSKLTLDEWIIAIQNINNTKKRNMPLPDKEPTTMVAFLFQSFIKAFWVLHERTANTKFNNKKKRLLTRFFVTLYSFFPGVLSKPSVHDSLHMMDIDEGMLKSTHLCI
jgi:hypothetical protein